MEYGNMKEVPLKFVAVQNETTSAILVVIGDDPPFEIMSWGREYCRARAASAERARVSQYLPPER